MQGARRVVLTGAAGAIGRAVSPSLSSRWDLHQTDVTPGAAAVLDVTDLDSCRRAFSGADAVVHLAAVPDPDAEWSELLPANVIGSYQVARAAMDIGVRRLVLASSLQAVSGYPTGWQSRVGDGPGRRTCTERPTPGARRSGRGSPPCLRRR